LVNFEAKTGNKYKMMKHMKRILICGYFGYGSLGDEAILSGMKNSLLQKHPDSRIVILSYYPDVVKKMHNLPAVYEFPTGIRTLILWIFLGRFWHTIKEMVKADLFIFGGGGFVSDWHWPNIPGWLIKAIYAKIFFLPVMSYGLGVGPINTRSGKFLTKIVFNRFSLITVRDEESKRCLEVAGVKRKIVTVMDPAILIEPDRKAELKDGSGKAILKLSEKKYKIGLAPAAMFFSEKFWPGQSERYFQLIQNFAAIGDFIYEKLNAEVFLLQISPNVDVDICQKIQQGMKNQSHLLFPGYSHLEIAGVVAKLDMIVGMRFHSIVLSAASGIPFVAIIYHYKTRCFLQQIGQLHRAAPLKFNPEDLSRLIIETWDTREEMKKELIKVLPTLKEEACIPSVLASRFLKRNF